MSGEDPPPVDPVSEVKQCLLAIGLPTRYDDVLSLALDPLITLAQRLGLPPAERPVFSAAPLDSARVRVRNELGPADVQKELGPADVQRPHLRSSLLNSRVFSIQSVARHARLGPGPKSPGVQAAQPRAPTGV